MSDAAPTIVFLDAHAANPGDLDFGELESLGRFKAFDRTKPAEYGDHAGSAEAVLTNKCALDAAAMDQMPKLRYIGVTATGYNIIDLAAARERGITVTNVPAYSTDATAQHAMALLLELTNHVGRHSREVAKEWPASPDFSYWHSPLIELAGLTMGIVGFGAIGSAVAKRAAAFGMNVIAHTRTPQKHEAPDVRFVALDELLAESDVVSLHAPLTDATKHMIDAAAIDKMKPSALLINCARGPLIDEPALAKALADGKLAGAGLDVLSQEPPSADHPLLSAPNCVVTPHQAWVATAARERLMKVVAGNLRAFLAGSPTNVVS